MGNPAFGLVDHSESDTVCRYYKANTLKKERASREQAIVTNGELKEKQSIDGALMWIATRTFPQLVVGVSETVGHNPSCTVAGLKLTNKLVRQAHAEKEPFLSFAKCFVDQPYYSYIL